MNETTAANKRKSPLRRFSALLVLVVLIFVVLLVSFTLAGIILYTLVRTGVMAPLGERTFVGILIFLLLVSLAISTVFSAIGGTLFLRPLRKLIDATKAVAEGNFDVRVEVDGPYEMQRLTNSFNHMAKQLGGIETLRSDFVSNVSHEFKTPVTSIRGFARLLKKDTLTPAQRNEYLDIILLESERLSQLSGNVLLLSNLDNTDALPETAAFSLDEQLRQSILLLSPQLDKKQLEIEVDLAPIAVTGSEELLKHVWLNLLNNAIKFTPDKGVIKVTATGTDEAATVTISDTGIGMDEEVQAHLFEKFYQGDVSHTTQGNGLGLSLVKRILDLSDGEIRIKSEKGQGTVFTVVLPKA